MLKGTRSLKQHEIDAIQKKIFSGLYDDWEINRLFETIGIQRRVLREMFNLFRSEPLRLVSTADPVRNSYLAYLKEMSSLEDGRK